MVDWLIPGTLDPAARVASLAFVALFALVAVVAAAEIAGSLLRHDPPRF